MPPAEPSVGARFRTIPKMLSIANLAMYTYAYEVAECS